MGGLLAKTWREVWLQTVLMGTVLMLFMALLTNVLPRVHEGFGEMVTKMPMLKQMMSFILRSEIGDSISAKTMQAFLWVHPTVLATIWAHEIILCTRMPAGEIDRGTVDVLLGLPVSRRMVYASETIVWLVTGAAVMALGLLGHRLTAGALADDMRPSLTLSMKVMLNLFCLYIAVGGIGFLISAVSNRRGRAIAAVFAVVLVSFLLSFLANFWPPAKSLAFLSVLSYYEPAQILRTGSLATGHVIALLAIGGTAWAAGGEIIARRDICTV